MVFTILHIIGILCTKNILAYWVQYCFNYLLQRFPVPPVPGIPPHHGNMYKLDPAGLGVPGQSGPHPLVDFQPVSTLTSLPSLISIISFLPFLN